MKRFSFLAPPVLVAFIAVGCSNSVEHTESQAPSDEIAELIDQLPPDGMIQLSRHRDAVLPSFEEGDSGVLASGIRWRSITDEDAFGIGFAGWHIQYKTNTRNIDCEVRTKANILKKTEFSQCIDDLTGVCDGADGHNNEETGMIVAEGYNRIYDSEGNVIGRTECNFPPKHPRHPGSLDSIDSSS
ncbi:MAG: hypothetical protein F4246_05365 [Rhodothermaceae bacterium]|nr:hypothetical protein [Rhodothermaceae bacterium]MXX58412.1 hypothetical protein [Rhodothermaceae bacterium]MYD20115.1 hypothetical protein [Rhodothermaceae bacterium]MYD56425.1 hypothetical protein [Rhodothermaceae bacterium]MYI44147.1 hypothetical protein [Rhodothermaceae bacterium]